MNFTISIMVAQIAWWGIAKRLSTKRYFTIIRKIVNSSAFKCVNVNFKSLQLVSSICPSIPKNFRLRNVIYSGLLMSVKEMFGMKKEEPEDKVILSIKRAVLALQEGNLDAAEQILHLSLKIAQELQNEQAVTYIFDMLANIAFQRGQYDKAEKLFKEIMRRMISTGTDKESNAIVEISLKLAQMYGNSKKHDLAMEGFQFCCDTQKKKVDSAPDDIDEDTLALWGMSVNWFAQYLLSQRDLKQARKLLGQAYDISIEVNGSDSIQTLVILNDLGSVCSLMQDYDCAIKHLQQVIDIAERTQNEHLSTFYCNLATIYMEKGIYREARANCEKALLSARSHKIADAENEALECLSEVLKAGY